MRTLVSGLLISCFALLLSVAVSAHVVSHTVLEPARASKVAQDVAGQALGSLPAEDVLPFLITDGQQRAQVEAVLAKSPKVKEKLSSELSKVPAYDWEGAKAVVVSTLKENGNFELAKKIQTQPLPENPFGDVEQANTFFEKELPSTVEKWQKNAVELAITTGLLAALTAMLGIAAANSRLAVAKGVANTIIISTGFVVILFIAIPNFLDSLIDARWWKTITQAIEESGNEVALPLLPILLVAVFARVALGFVPKGPTTDKRHFGDPLKKDKFFKKDGYPQQQYQDPYL